MLSVRFVDVTADPEIRKLLPPKNKFNYPKIMERGILGKIYGSITLHSETQIVVVAQDAANLKRDWVGHVSYILSNL